MKSYNLVLAAFLFTSLAVLRGAEPASTTVAIRVEHDVDYLPKDRSEKADLYFPINATTSNPKPAVVIIHGGSFKHGDKADAREQNIANTLAGGGFLAMSINYKLMTDAKPDIWPRNLYDCKTAVRWLRKNATRLNVDPNHIGAIGESAGGYLVVMLAVTGPESGLDPITPYGEYSCRIQAAVDMYAPIRMLTNRPLLGKSQAEAPELYRQAKPITHLDKNNPPFLIIHGTADKNVSPDHSKYFAEHLKLAGITHQFVLVEGAAHSFDLQPPQKDLRPIVLDFLNQHLRPTN